MDSKPNRAQAGKLNISQILSETTNFMEHLYTI